MMLTGLLSSQILHTLKSKTFLTMGRLQCCRLKQHLVGAILATFTFQEKGQSKGPSVSRSIETTI